MSSSLTNKEGLPGRIEYELTMLESTALNFGHRFINDGAVRLQYVRAIKDASTEIIESYQVGKYTAEEAAILASEQRNALLKISRKHSSDIGRAYAEYKKERGITIKELETKYASRLFPHDYKNLNQHQRNKVYYEIFKKSGTGNAAVTLKAKLFGYAGKGLIILTAAIATYDIVFARDKKKAIFNHGMSLGVGVMTSSLGGAAAGMMCGPAAPVCVSLGAFIGGVLGSLGINAIFRMS